jgi:hypothetical protein
MQVYVFSVNKKPVRVYATCLDRALNYVPSGAPLINQYVLGGMWAAEGILYSI